jgi:single-strand DNA-binding protein
MSSMNVNDVTIVGNLGEAPQLSTTTGGSRVAQLSVATSRQWRARQGGMQQKTEWHRVMAWNVPHGPQFADICEKHAKKGDLIYVRGRVEYRSYVDKEGAERWVTEIVATEVIVYGQVTRS